MNGTVNQGISLHKGQAGKEDPKDGCHFWVLAISVSGGCYFRNRLYNYVIYLDSLTSDRLHALRN